MKTSAKKIFILIVCFFSFMPLIAQNNTKEDLLTNARICFDKGEYQEARSFIRKYAMKDGDKEIAKEFSSKCKSCEEYLSKANAAYIEGDLWTAERYYEKLMELNLKHPNILQLIDKCQKQAESNEPIVSPPTQVHGTTLNTNDITSNSTVNKSSRKSIFQDNSYRQSKNNKYIAWGVVGTGYPWNLATCIEYRTGGVVGFGLYGDIGANFTHISVKDGGKYASCAKPSFRFIGGLKFFPYKGLFIDFGYGTIAPATANVQHAFGDPYSPNVISKDEKKEIRDMVSTGSGILFHIGHDLVTGLSKGYGFFLGINGGFAYDVVNKKASPSFNIKFGVAWSR